MLDLIQRTLQVDYTLLREAARDNIKINEDKANSKRQYHVYSTEDCVLRKIFGASKLDEKFIGPFTIQRVIDSNRLELDEGNKIVIHNIKNIRPFFNSGVSAQDVVYPKDVQETSLDIEEVSKHE